MTRLESKQRWLRLCIIGTCILLPLAGAAKTSLESRYPYDPACPWGRISNGQGMIHRCLSEKEAVFIANANDGEKKNEPDKLKKPPDSKPEKSEAAASLPQDVKVTLGPITASEGEITVGRLGLPMDRYKACVMENGGLKGKEGQVVVKFMARAEFGRAEGASVDSHQGVTEKAARCVAEVVDRRQVGTPTAPMAAVKLTFSFSH